MFGLSYLLALLSVLYEQWIHMSDSCDADNICCPLVET